MITSFFLPRATALLLAGALALPAMAAAVKRPFDLPPAADLHYNIQAKQSGLTLQGSALLQWQASDQRYQVTSETHAMLVGKILTATSQGIIDAYGLAPLTATEKRFRKSSTTTTFDRAAGNIRFTGSESSYRLSGGAQDRTSITWQLVANARGAPKKFIAGSAWEYFVVGQRDADPWIFKVGKREKISMPQGPVNAVRVARKMPPGSRDQQLDIWLAPSLGWYPVKLRIAEPDGDYIEQTLQRIDKK